MKALREAVAFLFRLLFALAGGLRDAAWNFRYAHDLVLFVNPKYPLLGHFRGRIGWRARDTISVEIASYQQFPPHSGFMLSLLSPIELRLEDENVTWCRGHRGEAADAFKATVAMDRS